MLEQRVADADRRVHSVQHMENQLADYRKQLKELSAVSKYNGSGQSLL